MYLGIDESNHGRRPEIFVGCITPYDGNIREAVIPKRRDKSESKRWKELLGLPYKHIIFDDEFKDMDLGNYKTIAIGEFAKFYSQQFEITKIFMDGNMRGPRLEKILEMLDEINSHIKLVYGKDLDRRTKLVNEADNIANLLFREYVLKNGRNKDKYESFLLHPNLKKYERFLL